MVFVKDFKNNKKNMNNNNKKIAVRMKVIMIVMNILIIFHNKIQIMKLIMKNISDKWKLNKKYQRTSLEFYNQIPIIHLVKLIYQKNKYLFI